MNDLDRILGAEAEVEPSSGLADAVMEAVRREAEAPEPIRFPWGRFLLGAGICLAGVVALLLLTLSAHDPSDLAPAKHVEIGRMLEDPRVVSTIWLAVGGLIAYVLSAASLRFANPSRGL